MVSLKRVKIGLNLGKTCFKNLKNPVSSMLFLGGIKKSCTIVTKTGNSYVFKENKIEPNCVNFNGINIVRDNWDCFFEFITDENEAYEIHNFENRSVIDIGGNVGDTALFFANKSSKNQIYAFEPVKHLYNIALKNINLNPNLKNNIHFYNYAIGCKKGKLKINTGTTAGYVSSEDYEVDVLSLLDAIEKYNIKPDVLKMDCEGCEYEIVNNLNLSMFNDIIFEHHGGEGRNPNTLVEKLKEQGFTVECHTTLGWPFEMFGIIYAYK